jgi:PAS domain S-box-containing protein
MYNPYPGGMAMTEETGLIMLWGVVGLGLLAAVKGLVAKYSAVTVEKGVSRLHHFFRNESLCPGVDALEGVKEIKVAVAEILAQMKPNGGKSIKDVVGQMKIMLDTLTLEMAHQRTAQEIAADAAGLLIMRADTDGRITWVSKSIRERFGAVDEGAFLGWSWLNHVLPEDRDRTRERWERAIEDESELTDEYRIVTNTGLTASVIDHSKPVKSGGKVIGWYSVLKVVGLAP